MGAKGIRWVRGRTKTMSGLTVWDRGNPHLCPHLGHNRGQLDALLLVPELVPPGQDAQRQKASQDPPLLLQSEG